MDTHDTQELELDSILEEYHSGDHPIPISDAELDSLLDVFSEPEAPAPEPEVTAEDVPAPAEAVPEAPAPAEENTDSENPAEPEAQETAEEVPQETTEAPEETPEAAPTEEAPAAEEAPAEETPTEETPAEKTPAEETPAPEETPGEEAPAENAEEEPPHKDPIPFPGAPAFRKLKTKLIEGPEKQYYVLSETNTGTLSIALLGILLLLGIGAVVCQVLGYVPESRMKLLIFSHVLGMLLAAALGSTVLMEGLGDLLHLKFSLNALLPITLAACCADAIVCLQDLRIPCCSGFTLEILFAMLSRHYAITTETQQMDTLRKASHLTGIVRQPDYYESHAAILRGEGELEDFMDTYKQSSGPKRVQEVYALVSLILCLGITVLAWVLHGQQMGIQMLAVSLLCAVPATYFTAVTAPTAFLEKRLHMVGTVICGWQGVKKLCKKAVFPLTDSDLFPKGSAKPNGVKFYSDLDPVTIISYAASLSHAAGGGLVGAFETLRISRNAPLLTVENFRDYGTGGVGCTINGTSALLGSMAFLKDQGVEIPAGTDVSQAVYASIDGQLTAVVAISYSKMRSAAAGLVSLCCTKSVTPVLLAGDFMLTEEFIRNKFSVSSKKVAMPDAETRSQLAAKQPDPSADVMALTTRPELISAAYAISGSASLRTACRLGTAISLIGGIAAMLVMLALAYLGSNELLTIENVLLYQAIFGIPGILATLLAKIG